MKLSEFLIDIGRPIAYHPGLRKLAGSTNATIFLSQFVYWTGKEASGDGWIYKTSDDIEEETGLSYKEQANARKKLVKAGLMSEQNKRLEHLMLFRVNIEKLNSAWEDISKKKVAPEMPNGQLGDEPSGIPSKTPLGSSLIVIQRLPENTHKALRRRRLFLKNLSERNSLLLRGKHLLRRRRTARGFPLPWNYSPPRQAYGTLPLRLSRKPGSSPQGGMFPPGSKRSGSKQPTNSRLKTSFMRSRK